MATTGLPSVDFSHPDQDVAEAYGVGSFAIYRTGKDDDDDTCRLQANIRIQVFAHRDGSGILTFDSIVRGGWPQVAIDPPAPIAGEVWTALRGASPMTRAEQRKEAATVAAIALHRAGR